jgi:hypothetical protein
MKSLPPFLVCAFLSIPFLGAQSPTPTPKASPESSATASPASPSHPLPPSNPASSPAATIELGDGNAAQKVAITAATQKLRYLFTIRYAKATTLALTAGPLVGPNGADFPVQLRIEGKDYGGEPLPLKPLVPVLAEMTGTFPLTGSYSGFLTLSFDDKKELRKIEITRSAGEVVAAVTGLNTVAFPWPCGNGRFRFSIKENAGRQGGEYTPIITSIARNATATQKIQAHFDKADVKPVPDEPGNFSAKIDGLSEAGEYTATLQVKATDSLPFDQSFIILVKHSWCLAVFTIAAGVGLSWLVRSITRERPGLLAKGNASELLATVSDIFAETPDRTVPETQVLENLESQLNKLLNRIDRNEPTDFAAVVTDLEGRIALVPVWINSRRMVDAIEPASLQASPRQTLKDVQAILEKEPPSKDEITTARTKLRNLPGEINDLIKAKLKENLAAFREELEKEKSRRAAQSSFLGKVDQAVMPRLTAMEDALERDQIEAARREFESARLAYAHILIDSLSETLDSISLPPQGFSPADWERVRAAVHAALTRAGMENTAEGVMAKYNVAYAFYLRELAQTLKNATEQWKQEVSDEERAKISAAVDQVLQKIVAGDLAEAGTLYAAAALQYKEMTSRLTEAGPMGGGRARVGPVAGSPQLGTLPDMVGLAQSERLGVRLRQTAKEVQDRIKTNDALITMIVLLASVLLGVKVLWAGEAVWGSFTDYVTAFLWGLGLHQFTFQGIEGLKDKLTK